MFESKDAGFKITFENSISVSIVWNYMSYSDNKVNFLKFEPDDEINLTYPIPPSKTAEIGVYFNDRLINASKFFKDGIIEDAYNTPLPAIGYVTANKVLDYLIKARDYEV